VLQFFQNYGKVKHPNFTGGISMEKLLTVAKVILPIFAAVALGLIARKTNRFDRTMANALIAVFAVRFF